MNKKTINNTHGNLILVCIATAMDHQQQAAHRVQKKISVTTVLEITSGKGHALMALINAANLVHDFTYV